MCILREGIPHFSRLHVQTPQDALEFANTLSPTFLFSSLTQVSPNATNRNDLRRRIDAPLARSKPQSKLLPRLKDSKVRRLPLKRSRNHCCLEWIFDLRLPGRGYLAPRTLTIMESSAGFIRSSYSHALNPSKTRLKQISKPFRACMFTMNIYGLGGCPKKACISTHHPRQLVSVLQPSSLLVITQRKANEFEASTNQ
jgi:hypothetical protein